MTFLLLLKNIKACSRCRVKMIYQVHRHVVVYHVVTNTYHAHDHVLTRSIEIELRLLDYYVKSDRNTHLPGAWYKYHDTLSAFFLLITSSNCLIQYLN